MKFTVPENVMFSQAVSNEIDRLLAGLEVHEAASQEALNSNVFGRAFVSVADAFTGVLQTFKTNVLKFPKGLKRSELREFIDSNMLKVKTVNGFTFDKCMKIQMVAPAGMAGSYVEASTSVLDVYNKLGALNIARLADTTFTNIYKSLSREDGNAGKIVNSAAGMVDRTVKSAGPTITACQKEFAGDKVANFEFAKCFKTMEEFRMTQSSLLDMESRLQEVKELDTLVTHMEDTLKSICSIITANEEVMSKPDVMALGNIAKGVALIFEAESMAATRQLALEHNLVLNINTLYNKVR